MFETLITVVIGQKNDPMLLWSSAAFQHIAVSEPSSSSTTPLILERPTPID
jgi:hypothetical protein